MRLSLAQINPTVGDFAGNLHKITGFIERAAEAGTDLICFPELAVPGYPPGDLLLNKSFLKANCLSLEELVKLTEGLEPAVVVGYADFRDGCIYNAAAVIHGGSLRAVYHKKHLSGDWGFEEERYFRRGTGDLLITCAGIDVRITIGADIGQTAGPADRDAPHEAAQLLLNLSAAPYYRGKQLSQERILAARAAESARFLGFVNLVGGQDDLVFDGKSMIFDKHGNLIRKGLAFKEDLLTVDLETEMAPMTHTLTDNRATQAQKVALTASSGKVYPPLEEPDLEHDTSSDDGEEADVYAALVLGVRDYVNKNGFSRAYLGLSGGIDSALVAAIAADALGDERLTGVFMPSPFTSRESGEDARQLAANLGIPCLEIPIADLYEAYLTILNPVCAGQASDIATQNIQARIRGNILMALTNQYGGIVLTTGNRSEISVGYTTLYGDMAGGFAVLRDVPKTLVYRLTDYRNRITGKPVIPLRILEKTPSAELRTDQKDEDELPPYNVLDQILEKYLEKGCSAKEIIAKGMEPGCVKRVITMITGSEHKRRQMPPGIRTTHLALGENRRMPVTNKFREI